ncbi:type I-F CRISPR-associated endoribonuclease Cas6/Csy4 [Providencia rettgeri]|uniref:type I-F CRISPR-associated endoribonuclease Cas6/Csy4 n=1 Tax=Providencia TaxID=586 RepID=UPI0008FAE0E3|nr:MULTISPECIES: type I-F CRISPR-associated endoribonuclease Cas6/Csy4 [Providencia]APC11182.1 CRISPR-associated endonuclease Cas6/Csy4 [Providencia rettgeri]AVL74783.1 type I-F CRISPR-associated endoribonuclease Cas6/Csy4 [Providencia rettgeri]EJD6042697.1 type I-F CRISPR-associated endoribonuclease Cas6/Csy4 [Providencia rettgeri]EJD6506697.1 type I-F CRISPR-associated endoribonuclease Cas6/Csy4 [Providencia rettgeri]EJD6670066.1 type I-F CRISPR-associated endoribonuclease Cas6/Csy4 [Provide
MNYYQEVTLLPDSTVSVDFLWQKVYQQIHIALADNQTAEGQSAIAVAFPEYGSVGFRLGRKIRLHAKTPEELEQLNLPKWLARLMDYAHIKSIQTVPEQSVPVSYIRRHVKGQNRIEADMQQKARLWSEKSGQSVAQCLEVLSKSRPKANNRLPFIWVTSLHAKNEKTGSRPFPLFIEKVVATQMQAGMFNCYGLSQLSNDQTLVATVPHF